MGGLGFTAGLGSLQVDLSEDQMKYSEANNAPLSSRNVLLSIKAAESLPIPGVLNTQMVTPILADTRIDERRYGVALKRGNFRKTQEDRVSLNIIRPILGIQK